MPDEPPVTEPSDQPGTATAPDVKPGPAGKDPVLHRQCKICNSPNRDKITEMIVNQRPYPEIIAEFPEDNLNKVNIYNHKNHVVGSSQTLARYKEIQEIAVEKAVNEILAIDQITTRAYNTLMRADWDKIPPRKLEVIGNILMQAIEIKTKLVRPENGPETELAALFAKVLERQNKPAPRVIDAVIRNADDALSDPEILDEKDGEK